MKKSELREIIREELQSIDEGQFKRGYWVILKGRGGELDREFTEKRNGFKAILASWAKDLDDGDVIAIERGMSEF